MSLVKFAARNHRQQVGKRAANPTVDDRATPPEVFEPINARFGFTLDACALPHNAKVPRFYTPDQNGLKQSWAGERVWCNPPYSSIEPWLEKAWFEFERTDYGEGAPAEMIAMLLPANRCEQGWWQRHVEPRRDGPASRGLRVQFLPGRLRFIAHDDTEIRPNARPPFGCALLVWSSIEEVQRAS